VIAGYLGGAVRRGRCSQFHPPSLHLPKVLNLVLVRMLYGSSLRKTVAGNGRWCPNDLTAYRPTAIGPVRLTGVDPLTAPPEVCIALSEYDRNEVQWCGAKGLYTIRRRTAAGT
jgi:hypothetical protein